MQLDKLLSNLAVSVSPFALCEVSAGWRLRLPPPEAVLIHYVLRGAGVLAGPAGTDHRLQRYWMAVVPKGLRHALASEGTVEHEQPADPRPSPSGLLHVVAGDERHPTLVVACGTVTVAYGGAVGLFEHLHEIIVVDVSASAQVPTAFEALLEEQERPQPGSAAMMAALMHQCLVVMLRQICGRRDCQMAWLDALEDARLSRVLDALLDEPERPHSLESLASLAAMSRSAFAEHFAATFGRSPMEFLRDVRMQRAAHLLDGGELPVETVAARVGFSSRSHFSRAFKACFRVSPVAFRARQSQRASARTDA